MSSITPATNTDLMPQQHDSSQNLLLVLRQVAVVPKAFNACSAGFVEHQCRCH